MESKKKYTRIKWSDEQKNLLNSYFNNNKFPSNEERKRLSNELNVNSRNIQVWFQNKRQRLESQTCCYLDDNLSYFSLNIINYDLNYLLKLWTKLLDFFTNFFKENIIGNIYENLIVQEFIIYLSNLYLNIIYKIDEKYLIFNYSLYYIIYHQLIYNLEIHINNIN